MRIIGSPILDAGATVHPHFMQHDNSEIAQAKHQRK
jgi:hypothetical protein